MLSKLLFAFFIMSTVANANWSEYKSLFIAKDGRVIDRANSDVTHSESIGYAMYLALRNDDMKTFEKIHDWYTNNLKRNEFGLFGWKWGKAMDGTWHTLDFNNASDGDLWIAYDNLLMFEKTKLNCYKQEALCLIKSIKKNIIVKQNKTLYLLPGVKGFNSNDSLEINLSYYLFFIFDKFKEYDNDKMWKKLKSDGVKLLLNARFTPMGLNADWIKIDKFSGAISASRNKSFGYDAIRIPFNILKSDLKNKAELLLPYKKYVDAMKASGTVFGVTDLKNGNISLYNYSFGHLSVYNMIDKYFYDTQSFSTELTKLKGTNKDDYYSHSIFLFSTFN